MASNQPPLDSDKIQSELMTFAKGNNSSSREQLLTCLQSNLKLAKAELRKLFYDENDGATYVGMHAWVIDVLLQLLYSEKAMPKPLVVKMKNQHQYLFKQAFALTKDDSSKIRRTYVEGNKKVFGAFISLQTEMAKEK